MRELAGYVASVLREGGAQAWIVGGAVRDVALERTPGDLDIATDAVPDRVEALFPRTQGVGRAFGTMLVIHAEQGIEVTTFRTEGAYSDGRRPDEVRYSTSLEEDAQRRDFTVNALYLDPLSDRLADPTGGMADLAAGRLRAVGDPRRRFAEDALRILRLARFAARFGFEIEEATLQGAMAESQRLTALSAERVLAEVVALIEGPDPVRALRLLQRLNALERVLGGPPRAAALEALERLSGALSAASGLALLLPQRGGELDARMRALKASNALRSAVTGQRRAEGALADLLAEGLASGSAASAPPAAALRVLREPDGAAGAALLLARAQVPDAAEGQLRGWLRSVEQMSRAELFPDLLLGRAELAEAGVRPGPAYGEVLRELEDAQLRGELTTRAEARAWLERRRT